MYDFNAEIITRPSVAVEGSTDVQIKMQPNDYEPRTATGRTLARPLILGKGQLNWNRRERVSDRYGAVGLYSDAHWQAGENSLPLRRGRALVGKLGVLRVVVLETRDADHIGDLTHGWHVGGAQVGETYDLGEGRLFFDADLGDKVGVEPEDGRAGLWLDGPNLYRCHSQTVRLEFVPFAD